MGRPVQVVYLMALPSVQLLHPPVQGLEWRLKPQPQGF